jgi:acyl-CoA thioester hydrolase
MKLPYVKTTIQIRFTDLDIMGHVSNSVYMQYFDMGRVDFFIKIREAGHCPSSVVASIHIDMLHEINLLDKVHIETWCSRIGTKSMQVEQHIFANGICATKASLVLVGFDRETRKTLAFPADWEISDHPSESSHESSI